MFDETIAKIVIGIFLFALILPSIAWRTYLRWRFSAHVKEIVSKPFVCPNCGHRFYTQQKFIKFLSDDRAILKCPACHKRDICGRPYDLDSND